MKSTKLLAIFLVLLCSAFAAESIFAQRYHRHHHRHHHHHHGFSSSIIIGAPIFWPQPAYPRVVVARPQVAYVEQATTQPGENPADSNSWFYCVDSQTYYPYVQQCASPWQRVTPQPPY